MRGNESRKLRSEECNFDRLSPLPDDVLYRILSFVDCLDVVRTCVLAKRWRNVWRSVPCLNFDLKWFAEHNCYSEPEPEPEPEPDNESQPESESESETETESESESETESESESYTESKMKPRDKFWNFIDWVLLLRNDSRIRRINLTSDNSRIEDVNALLCFAGRNNVQELYFRDCEYTNKELNCSSELCETLESLTLEFRKNICLRVAKAFSCLKSLFLRGVFMSGDAVEKLFSGDCAELEDLHLEDIQVDSKLNIRAPNLVSFSYVGPMLLGFAFLDTVSLQHISIRILHIPWPYLEGPFTARFIGLNHAKSLTLSSRIVKYFSPTNFDPLGGTFVLDNLNYLMLGIRGNEEGIEGLINLLKLSPNIETLAIKFPEFDPYSRFGPQRQSSRGGSWEARVEDIDCLSYHVKNIQVSNYDNSQIAFELVKFLFQNGRVLKDMEIIHSHGEREVKDINKIIELPKASSKVDLCFASKPDFSCCDENSDADH